MSNVPGMFEYKNFNGFSTFGDMEEDLLARVEMKARGHLLRDV